MANSVEVKKKKKLNISGYGVKLPVCVLIFQGGAIHVSREVRGAKGL